MSDPEYQRRSIVDSPGMREMLREALRAEVGTPLGYIREQGVVWQYGTGMNDIGFNRLRHPRYAEQLANGNLLICDSGSFRVIEVNKTTKEIEWQYGQADIYGVGDNELLVPNVAHRLTNGNTIIGQGNPDTGGPVGGPWSYPNAETRGRITIVSPSGEIVWDHFLAANQEVRGLLFLEDENTILYTDGNAPVAARGLHKIQYPSAVVLWEMLGFYGRHIWEIPNRGGYKPSSYGGDYLVAEEYPNSRIIEVRDSDQSIQWTYGSGAGVAPGTGPENKTFDRLVYAGMAIRGGSEWRGTLTFIVDADRSAAIAVNKNKELVMQYGDGNPLLAAGVPNPQMPLLTTPDSVNWTENGNLLIADSGGARVVEVVLRTYHPMDILFKVLDGYTTTDAWVDSEIAEVRWYSTKLIHIVNSHAANSLDWRVLGSMDNMTYTVIKIPEVLAADSEDYFEVLRKWRFLKIQTMSTVAATPATVDAFLSAGVQ